MSRVDPALVALHRAGLPDLPDRRTALHMWRLGQFPAPARWPTGGSPLWRLDDLHRWRLHRDGRSRTLVETYDGEDMI